jgi:hypothetical protein
MARRAINRQIYEEKIAPYKGDSVAYMELLSRSPHRRHLKKAAKIVKMAEVLNKAKLSAEVEDAQVV